MPEETEIMDRTGLEDKIIPTQAELYSKRKKTNKKMTLNLDKK